MSWSSDRTSTAERLAALSATVVLTATLFAAAHYPDQGLPGVQQAAVTGLVFGAVFAWRTQTGW